LTRAAVLGITVTGAMRVLLFLAVWGVVGRAGVLDPGNPAASAFRIGAGEWGYRVFGVVLWAAAITSVVGCSYTSLSFVRTLSAPVQRHLRASLILSWRGPRLLPVPGTAGPAAGPGRRVERVDPARHARGRADRGAAPGPDGRVPAPGRAAGGGWLAWAVSVLAGVFALREMARLWAGR
jgi:hypothetical protein